MENKSFLRGTLSEVKKTDKNQSISNFLRFTKPLQSFRRRSFKAVTFTSPKIEF